MSGEPKIATCQECGETFSAPHMGRPPKYCPEHRKVTGTKANAHRAENDERFKLRRKAKRRAAAFAQNAQDIMLAGELAAALSVFGRTETAAKFVGINLEGEALAELEKIARDAHKGIIEGDVQELGKRLMCAMHLSISAMIQNRGQVSPRDTPHMMRAMAQVFDLTVGSQRHSQYASIQLVVVGADGKPFDPTKVEQVVKESAE